MVGGDTESYIYRTSWTGVGFPVALVGGYMAIDGTSNLTELHSNVTKVYARSKNITRAKADGLMLVTDIVDFNNQLFGTTSNPSGMILQRTLIHK